MIAADEISITIGNMELPGKEKDQVSIGATIDGCRGDTYFTSSTVDAGDVEWCSGVPTGAALDDEL